MNFQLVYFLFLEGRSVNLCASFSPFLKVILWLFFSFQDDNGIPFHLISAGNYAGLVPQSRPEHLRNICKKHSVLDYKMVYQGDKVLGQRISLLLCGAGMETRASCTLDKHSSTELHPQQFFVSFSFWDRVSLCRSRFALNLRFYCLSLLTAGITALRFFASAFVKESLWLI